MTFSGGLSSVREARRFLSSLLEEWGADDYEFAAPQVLSELATNAALHARSSFTVELHLDEGYLQIEVTDSSPRLPRVRTYAVDATTGRGMGLVAALSSSWGTTTNGTGKTVWARVVPDGAAFGDLDLDAFDAFDLASAGEPVPVPRSLARPGSGAQGVAGHLEAKAS
jgi:anti-sigma regulatory factor (Ser/Thr protein kinase)